MLLESELRGMVRRVLRESRSAGLACLVTRDGDGRTAFVWNPSAAMEVLRREGYTGRTLEMREAARAAAVGIVGVKPPEIGECWGAWQVSYIAKAPGTPGGIMYPLAYALSPGGRLVSDRHVTSDGSSAGGGLRGAATVWRRAFDSTGEETESAELWDREPSGRGRWRLDEPPPHNRTPASKDDCELSSEYGKDHLNWAYAPVGIQEHRAMLTSMKAENEAAEDELMDLFPERMGIVDSWRDILKDACWGVWHTSATFTSE